MGSSYRISYPLLGLILTASSQFEVGSNSATVSDPISEATTFFTHFDQPEVNDLNLRTSGVLGHLMLASMAFEFLRIVLLNWRQSIAAVGTSCRDSSLGVPQESIS